MLFDVGQHFLANVGQPGIQPLLTSSCKYWPTWGPTFAHMFLQMFANLGLNTKGGQIQRIILRAPPPPKRRWNPTSSNAYVLESQIVPPQYAFNVYAYALEDVGFQRRLEGSLKTIRWSWPPFVINPRLANICKNM